MKNTAKAPETDRNELREPVLPERPVETSMRMSAAAAHMHGVRPLVIPVFIPNAGCPHRCVFCNQVAVTGRAAGQPTAAALREQVDRFLSHRTRQRRAVEIAIFGGNFLGLDAPTAANLLKAAARYVSAGKVDGLRFSTRPDTLTRETIELLRPYPVTTVELGAQSMSDSVLKHSRRGHSAADTSSALMLLKSAGYATGLQLMVGLPSETRSDVAATAQAVVTLAPDFVRIYPTLVLAGSPLAQSFHRGRFRPIELSEAVWRAKMLHRRFFKAGIRTVRMGLQASEDLDDPSRVLAGPYHPAFGQLVYSALFLEAAAAVIDAEALRDRHLRLTVHPRSESKLRGLHNRNLDELRGRFGLRSLTISTDADLTEEQCCVDDRCINVMSMETV